MQNGTRVARLAPVAPAGAWQQRVGALSRLPALIRELGADPATVLADAELAPGALEAPDGAISYLAFGRLLAAGAARTRCPHFGLLTGGLWRIEDLGDVGEVVRHSPTVGDALRALAAHQQLNSGGGLAFLIERPTLVDLGYAIYHPDAVGCVEIYDAVLATGIGILRELGGPDVVLSEVHIAHARPRDARAWRTAFGVAPSFDATTSALRFPASWMTRPVAGAVAARRDAALRRIASHWAGDVVPRAMRASRLTMLQGDVSGEATARMLSMHRRTLNRRLKEQGTTFQAVLDRVRFEAARQLLEETRLAQDEIASALGYASVSPFMRSFRRWTGTTPGQWRRSAVREADGAPTA